MNNKVAFVLASTDHGPMIINRVDFSREKDGGTSGVGALLLGTGKYVSDDEMTLHMTMFALLRKHRGIPLTVIDGGANIGVFTLVWAKLLDVWGMILAFEPQDRIYYALAGNVALNNLWNVKAMHCALGISSRTHVMVPRVRYNESANFGGVSMLATENKDFAQKIDPKDSYAVPCTSIDNLELPRVDFIKLDIEGMEIEAIAGARKTIDRDKPVMLIEHIKVGVPAIEKALPDYKLIPANIDVCAVHKDDPIWNDIKLMDKSKEQAA